MEHHNFWKEHQNGNFKFNESFCDFYPNSPKTSFIHKMGKSKA